MFRTPVAVAVVLLAPAAAMAQSDLDTMELASNLGAVLAGGDKCGYTFDSSAIIAFVRENVPADDMGFAALLNTMTIGAGGQLDSLSDSAFIAQCAVVEQTAWHFGFMK
jgi:hypothetical protein